MKSYAHYQVRWEQVSGLSLRPATLLKQRLWHRFFPVNFVKFLRKPFFIEQLWTTAPVGIRHRIHGYTLDL